MELYKIFISLCATVTRNGIEVSAENIHIYLFLLLFNFSLWRVIINVEFKKKKQNKNLISEPNSHIQMDIKVYQRII